MTKEEKIVNNMRVAKTIAGNLTIKAAEADIVMELYQVLDATANLAMSVEESEETKEGGEKDVEGN